MYYLAERRRSHVAQIMIFAALGAMVILFASFGFRQAAFEYVFAGGAGRFWFSVGPVVRFFSSLANAGITIAVGVALLLYAGMRRSRYFGNTAPLLMVLGLAFLYTTQVVSAPWMWALPFLFTFIGGVFSDALEMPGQARRASCCIGAFRGDCGVAGGAVPGMDGRSFGLTQFFFSILCAPRLS